MVARFFSYEIAVDRQPNRGNNQPMSEALQALILWVSFAVSVCLIVIGIRTDRLVFIWAGVAIFVILGAWSIYADEGDISLKDRLLIFGMFLLFLAVWFPIAYTLEHALPDWGFFHGTDENGDPFDRRDMIAFFIALPVAYLLVRGFNAWRKDKAGW